MSTDETELDSFNNAHLKFEKQNVLPGRPQKYKMLINGVYFGSVLARRDKTSPKVLGKHPILYSIINDPTPRTTVNLGELVRWMYELKRTEGWSPDAGEKENESE
jgi:hypothetical protein